MIAKDEASLWSWMLLTRLVGVVEQKNSFCIRMMLQVELQQALVKRKALDTYFCRTSLMMMLLFLVAISHHIQAICVSMTIAQCQPLLC